MTQHPILSLRTPLRRTPRPVQRRALRRLIPLAALVLLPASAAGWAGDTRAAAVAGANAFHLRLEKSEPGSGAVLTVTPSVIRLWFSLPPELAITAVKLVSADGRAVALAAPRRGAGAKDPVEVDVKSVLTAGRYTVSWRTSSKDGHPIKGDFSFTLKGAAD